MLDRASDTIVNVNRKSLLFHSDNDNDDHIKGRLFYTVNNLMNEMKYVLVINEFHSH